MERPTFIDISQTSSRAPSSAASSRYGQPSPRIQHYDGDIPPTLSPLDAFAAESRRLAKELEATRIAGEKRMSRLPPALVSKTLNQHQANRPACFRTLSSGSQEALPEIPPGIDTSGPGINPTLTEPLKRPASTYPRISAVLGGAASNEDEEVFSTPRESTFGESTDYFGERSEPLHAISESPTSATVNSPVAESNPQSATQETSTNILEGLAPPNAAFARNKSSHESSDDDYQSSNAGSTFSRPRKLSGSSGMSFPVSPALPTHDRKASNDSDTSLASQKPMPRQTYNFSRPLSSMSMGLRVDSPSMQQSSRSLERKPSHFSDVSREVASFEDDRSINSEGFVTGDSSSYTHKKFTLPRGRTLDKANNRISQLFMGLSTPDFKWQEPLFPGTPTSETSQDGYFGKMSTSSDRSNRAMATQPPPSQFAFDFGQYRQRKSQDQEQRPSSSRTLPDFNRADPSSPKQPLTPQSATFSNKNKRPTLPTIPGSTTDEQSLKSVPQSTGSEATIRPITARSVSNYQVLSADEHVEKAIQLHESGDLKESTYHLRIAAKQNHPTAMLLYALASRHGWGMRANQKEGVAWLRKAVDSAMLEVAEDEDPQSGKPKADVHEKKSHRAQFALTIYELGVSHLNGWGVEQDKALALRCFEIAGNWGDTDALTEAGFCYAQGVGCKKDLKKAAKFYRLAAEKGVSMIGNSWIYKDKYLDQDDDTNDASRRGRGKAKDGEQTTKKPREKSKTRSIWGRKKSVPASPVGS